MKQIIITILLICSFSVAFSQTRVIGRIVDAENNASLEFAQVAIFSNADTALVAGTTTATNGTFAIDRVKKGQYIFKAAFMGYGTIEKIIDVADESKPLALGDIQLTKGVELEGIEITEMLIPILIKGDTVEFNAEAFRPVQGSPLIELLKRMPGFEVDENNNITFQGKPISSILVGGEEFFGDNPNVAAQNIPADYVARVQTFNRRSRQAEFTRIDDGREEMVVNLVFRPGLQRGVFGRAYAGGGADAGGTFRHESGAMMNYFHGNNQLTFLGNFNNVADEMSAMLALVQGGQRMDMRNMQAVGGAMPQSMPTGGIAQSLASGVNFTRKVNDKLFVGGHYRFTNSDGKTNRNVDRENMLSDGTSQFYNEESNSHRTGNHHSLSSQIRYNPNEDNQLVISPSFGFTTGNNKAFTSFRTLDDTLAMINDGTRKNLSESQSIMAGLRTEYRRRLNKPQRTISFTLGGNFGTRDNTAFNYSLNEFSTHPTDTIDQKTLDNVLRYNWDGSVTFTEPLINNFALELRYSISNNENRTERMTFDYNPFTQSYDLEDSVFSSDFGNSIINQHFTIRLQKNEEKYRYTLGFSLINNNNFNYNKGRPDIPQNAFNVAPQADFRYAFSPRSTIDLRYFGQTRQPTAEQLQPVPDNSNSLNIRVGNPNLKPEFSHTFSISQRKQFANMSSIQSGTQLGMTHNGITNITITNPDLFENIHLDSGLFRPGMRLMMADNVDFTYRISGNFTYSTTLFSRSISLFATTQGGLNNSKSLIDKDINVLNNFFLSENLRISYRHRRFDVSLNGNFRINNAKYSLQPERNNIFYTTMGGADFNWQIIGNGKLVLSSDFRFSRMDGFSADHNPRWSVWNAQLAWNIGRTNKANLRLQAVDILNNDNNTTRNIMPNYIEDVTTTNILRRYFLLTFTYNLQPTHRPR
jgi:hypothetical protein